MKISLFGFILILFFTSQGIAQNKATFAGGCFWCMEEAFEKVEGVISATSGFMAKVEVVEVVYDPSKTNYEGLLETFWKNIDPTDSEGQFCDRGGQYRAAIFYHDDQQRNLAERSKETITKALEKEIVTPVLQAIEFQAADSSHQDYYKKKAYDYKQYKIRCGRDRRLRSIWK